MGSVVISGTVHHFPYANSHHHSTSQDPATTVAVRQRSTSIRHASTPTDPSNSLVCDVLPAEPVMSFTPAHPAESTPTTTAHGQSRSPRLKTYPSKTVNSVSQPTESFARPRAISLSSVHHSSLQPVCLPAPPTHNSPRRVKVQSLSHIIRFATDESSPFCQTRHLSWKARRDPNDIGPQYEISDMPVTDVIEMVAGLLTKITTTNDRQHEHIHHRVPPPEDASGLSQESASVLAFHGKNVPVISILSYLTRIHKYCPTTYEVFLSLLVYFDRMTERVNRDNLQSLREANQCSLDRAATTGKRSPSNVNTSKSVNTTVTAKQFHQPQTQAATPPPSGSLGSPATTEGEQVALPLQAESIERPLGSDRKNYSHFFVVDSYNIHRLVIAGVTCASKFFSDVFFTNSRYAKVGGLPLIELNHLELQFLILNDFRLLIPLEEMQAYGTMLVEFYAREVVARQQFPERQAAASAVSVPVTMTSRIGSTTAMRTDGV